MQSPFGRPVENGISNADGEICQPTQISSPVLMNAPVATPFAPRRFSIAWKRQAGFRKQAISGYFRIALNSNVCVDFMLRGSDLHHETLALDSGANRLVLFNLRGDRGDTGFMNTVAG